MPAAATPARGSAHATDASSAVNKSVAFAVANDACEHGASASSSPNTASHPHTPHTPPRSASHRILSIILERPAEGETDVLGIDHRRDHGLFHALGSRCPEIQ